MERPAVQLAPPRVRAPRAPHVLDQPLAMPDTPLLRSVRAGIDAGLAAGAADASRATTALPSLDALQRAVVDAVRPGVPTRARLDADITSIRHELPLRTRELDSASLWQARNGLKAEWVAYLQAHARELAPGVDVARGEQLLQVVRQATGDITTFAKQQFDSPRPFVYDPSVPPVGGLAGTRAGGRFADDPNANGYPSGHTSLAVAQATVLAALLPAHRDELMEMAHQVGLSRVYGAMHFPSDVEAGARIGAIVADWMLAHSSLAPGHAAA